MPVFTSIGLTLGAAALGVGAFAAGVASKGNEASQASQAASTDTGALTSEEAQTAAKKRAFRSGILFTSPTGLSGTPSTSSAKLR